MQPSSGAACAICIARLVARIWTLYSALKNPDNRMANKEVNFSVHLILGMFFFALTALHFVKAG